ncbi:uncharacterized protein IL334_004700 [Kwoniella shivajii]|uniref:Nucleolar protein 12 n=1 Tax=Kwoniella shivajii TaxID=564305 RepID=A0ABZ1D188_9TREE|nr:hypothetical protein IL334_004700 [Kwoniella shivajii]
MSAALTKKQQKLAAFRNKQKTKKAGATEEVQPDLPEEDLLDDAEEDAVVISQSDDKKQKGKSGDTEAVDDKVKDGDKSTTVDKGKKRKTAWDEDEDGEAKKKSKKDIKQRFILFVGNLSFKTTKEEIQLHFEPTLGQKPAVRLLTSKPTPGQSAPKSRGIAFLELPTSAAMQLALKLHHSNLKGRTINVELTAGGGGAGEDRKRKIEERNKRVGTQRERKAEREKEEGGEEGENANAEQDGEVDGKDGKQRTRGGRRVKSKTKPDNASAPVPKRPRSDASGSNGALTGWASRQAGTISAVPSFNSSRPPRRDDNGGRRDQNANGRDKFQKKKWTPTGANAQPVG